MSLTAASSADTPARPTSTSFSSSALFPPTTTPNRHRSPSRSHQVAQPLPKTPTRTGNTNAGAGALSAAPTTDSPGTWRHPRLDEITRRKRAAMFNDKNARMLAYCGLHFALIWVADQVVQLYLGKFLLTSVMDAWWFVKWTAVVLRIGTFIMAARPLFRATDDLSDIPLSPGQRTLLGLPPSSVPASPDAHYSTPPRYSRTPSLAGSVSSNRSWVSQNSPLAGRGDPLFYNNHNNLSASQNTTATTNNNTSYSQNNHLNNSIISTASGAVFDPRASLASLASFASSTAESSAFQFSPATSPLLLRSPLGGGRRYSIGSPSVIGSPRPAAPSLRDSLYGEALSPSPSAAKRTSVAVNNKWLFERGRRSSGTWVY